MRCAEFLGAVVISAIGVFAGAAIGWDARGRHEASKPRFEIRRIELPIRWLKRERTRLVGDLVIADGNVESRRRALVEARTWRNNTAAELREVEAQIAKKSK